MRSVPMPARSADHGLDLKWYGKVGHSIGVIDKYVSGYREKLKVIFLAVRNDNQIFTCSICVTAWLSSTPTQRSLAACRSIVGRPANAAHLAIASSAVPGGPANPARPWLSRTAHDNPPRLSVWPAYRSRCVATQTDCRPLLTRRRRDAADV